MARILIAEDDEIVSAILHQALIDAGHAVGVIDNGEDALRVILAKKPDLVILDCNLPSMQGLTVLRHIRADKELWAMPVIILTALRDRGNEEIAIYTGADAYLRKPFDADYVVFRVEQALEERAARTPTDRRFAS